MLNKKYKSNSITIKGSNHKEFLNGDASKSKRRDVRGVSTHGAGLVNGMISGSDCNGLQAKKVKSQAKGRGVGTEKLDTSTKELIAKQRAGKTEEKAKVSNSAIKITMGQTPVTNKRQEVSGTYLNNKLHTIKTNFKRKK